MDAYEATRVVYSRIQALDPDHASKIIGYLLIQDHGEKEMIRLAFGPEALLHSVIFKARRELGFDSPPQPPPPPSSDSNLSPSPVPGHYVLSPKPGNNLPARLWQQASPFSRSANPNSSADDLLSGGGDAGFPNLGVFDDSEASAAAAASELYPDEYSLSWGMNNGEYEHRRSASAADACLEHEPSFGWKPCMYFARGYCKNGLACRFVHGGGTFSDDSAIAAAAAAVEQEVLLRAKSPRSHLMASAFPYSPTGSPVSKSVNFLLQQKSESHRSAAAAAAAAMLLSGGDEAHKLMAARSPRLERMDLAAALDNPSARQIYLTFPADSTFTEEDVSDYFSNFGPVQDVRIPYQQKRMFGFVTFVYPETVKMILAKGNPHFVCDARVLVKPYKEKGKVPEKFRKQQLERVDFSLGGSPTGLIDSRDPFELPPLLGARMLYNNCSAHEAILRRKMEEQQQAAELQQAIELQGRRFMGLQLFDHKPRNLHLPPSPTPINNNLDEDKKAAAAASSVCPAPNQVNGLYQLPVNAGERESPTSNAATATVDRDVQESFGVLEHNLPDSPFTSLANGDASSSSQEMGFTSNSNCTPALMASSPLLPPASYSTCLFQMPRFSPGHGALGM